MIPIAGRRSRGFTFGHALVDLGLPAAERPRRLCICWNRRALRHESGGQLGRGLNLQGHGVRGARAQHSVEGQEIESAIECGSGGGKQLKLRLIANYPSVDIRSQGMRRVGAL